MVAMILSILCFSGLLHATDHGHKLTNEQGHHHTLWARTGDRTVTVCLVHCARQWELQRPNRTLLLGTYNLTNEERHGKLTIREWSHSFPSYRHIFRLLWPKISELSNSPPISQPSSHWIQLTVTTASSGSLRSFLPKYLFGRSHQSTRFPFRGRLPALQQCPCTLPLGESVWPQHFDHVLPLNRKPQGYHSQVCTRHVSKIFMQLPSSPHCLVWFSFSSWSFLLSHILPKLIILHSFNCVSALSLLHQHGQRRKYRLLL